MRIKEITNEHILFDNGAEITYYHDQDCCENVYADFEQLKTTAIMNEEFRTLKPKFIKDTGVKLKSYLIPCYNSQNGYYSSDLELIINYPDGKSERWDISDFVKDDID